MERLITLLKENPPTVSDAATAAYVAVAYWASTFVPDTVPDYVTWSVLVLAVVAGVGAIGQFTQRWTTPVANPRGSDGEPLLPATAEDVIRAAVADGVDLPPDPNDPESLP